MNRIRGGRGLGDSLYIRPIAEHFVRQGRRVTVLSDYPDVFIGAGVKVEAFNRNDANIVAHYVSRKTKPGTNQWQDVCMSAGVSVPLRFDWTVRNTALVAALKQKAAGRPIIVVHGGRAPMGRTDGFGRDLLPAKAAFDAALAALHGCFTVQIGNAPQIYPLAAELSLNGSTSVADLLDIGSVCDGVVAQCSFAVPLAEVFDKPLLAIWSSRAAKSNTLFICQTTPEKVLSAPKDRFVMDDWPAERVAELARAFMADRVAVPIAA